jgi:hypothetical protein
MAGHSRPKDGVASARLCPAIHVFSLAGRKAAAIAPPIPVISRAELLRASSVIGPHLAKEGWEMSDTYIIEVASQAAGIVVRDPDGYRFFAATHRFNPLEGQLFRNAREAERAARRLVTGGVTLAA